MREAFNDAPRAPQGPVEWVKAKLATRYTEFGRIASEVDKLEKVMGQFAPEQREAIAIRMISEGKVKKDVTKTIIKDVVVATVVVASGGYLIARPDARAKLAATLGAGSRVIGGDIADRLASYRKRVKPTDDAKTGVVTGVMVALASGAHTLITKGMERSSAMFGKLTDSSLLSMEGRVVNADVAYRTAPEGRRDRAMRKLSTLEMRQADAQMVAEFLGNTQSDLLPSIRTGRQIISATQIDPNRDAREAKVQEQLTKRKATNASSNTIPHAE